MWKYTVEVGGMMCGMCESHICSTVRNEFDVKKVTANRSKKEAVIISETELDEEKLMTALKETGYDIGALKKEPYEKKGFFHW